MRRWTLALLCLLAMPHAWAAPRKNVGVLVVYVPSDVTTAGTAIAVMKRLQTLRDEARYRKEQLPFCVYYFDRPDEMRRCQQLGVSSADLPLVAVVTLNAAGDPTGILNRFAKARDASSADAAFDKAEKLLGLASPHPVAATASPMASPTPMATSDDHAQLAIEDVAVEYGPQIHFRVAVHNTGESTIEGPLHLTIEVRADAQDPWGAPVADLPIDKIPREWKLVREADVDPSRVPPAGFHMRMLVRLPDGQTVGSHLVRVLPPGSKP
ncbi:MAG TPA: hypothetical protein VGO93_03655 [Candidatus Xenobia bacterium]